MVAVKKKVFALGLFDCLHIGHRYLLQKAYHYAKLINADFYVLTFGDSFFSRLKLTTKEVYVLKERQRLLKALGYKNIIVLDENEDFLNLSPENFLDYLAELNPCALFVGDDYTFGKNAAGTAADLCNYFQSKSDNAPVKVFVESLIMVFGKKISSTEIRLLLAEGNIQRANSLLGEPYFIFSPVIRGRGDGRKIDAPTANINSSENKLLPADGVYVTETLASGKVYRSVTNVGGHPTFNDEKRNIETLIIGYSGDLYNKSIKVSFLEKIREIRRFTSVEELRQQINSDIMFAKSFGNNNTDENGDVKKCISVIGGGVQ